MLYYMMQRYGKYLIYANLQTSYFIDNQGFNFIYTIVKKLTLLLGFQALQQDFSTQSCTLDYHL